ncbi:MAG: MBL fold metallo-hydrolase [Clostridia bacterium]|nr:MBL fold metallo-hydrolase [Clostridia bacterium]
MKKYIVIILCFFMLPLFVLCAGAVQIGDADGNGILTSADARLALRHSVDLENLDADALIAADADNDNAVTAADARLILREVVGLERFAGDFRIDFIDVGQAKSILVQNGDMTMLVDAGNAQDGELVCDYLYHCGVTSLDFVVCTHAHEDHAGGLADVMNAYTVTQAVFAPSLTADTANYKNFRDACKAQKLTPIHPTLGSTISFGDCEIEFLGPALADTTDLNDSSIVLKITYEDTSFLLTGDAETASEYAMIDEGFDLSADVLDVGHHGSSSSTSYVFLRQVMPEFAVISCGTDNDYGHPHEEVTSRLADARVITYRTDKHGTIQVISNGKALAFYTDNDFEADIPDSPIVKQYIGNINSKKFHLPTCGNLPAEHNRIYFASRDTAIAQGYAPCGSCKP